MSDFEKPFDGEISRFFEEEAPKAMRKAIEKADKNDILDPDYPYDERMDKGDYEQELEDSQIELVKMQRWIVENDKRVVIVFEGRDRGGQRRCDQTPDAQPQSACCQCRGARQTIGSRTRRVVFSALHKTPADDGRDDDFRPLVVQSRRR